MSLPRMRTAAGVLALIREAAPNTEVTLYYLRQLIKSQQIPTVAVGRKRLVNADAVIEYIAAGGQAEQPASGRIRKVPEKQT